jgi:type I restriction enzyme, R subunit
MCRAVFSKFKACITIEGVNAYAGPTSTRSTSSIKACRQDREQADITDIIRQLHQVVDEAIETQTGPAVAEEPAPYDISKIDFDRLRGSSSAARPSAPPCRI